MPRLATIVGAGNDVADMLELTKQEKQVIIFLMTEALLDKEIPLSIRILASLAAIQSFRKAINL